MEVRPKESKGSLEPMANTIAVANGILFDYYPVKLGVQKGLFVEILKAPAVIVEGYITYKRKLYAVSFKDYIRRKVNVARHFQPIAASPIPATIREQLRDPVQSTVNSDTEREIHAAADLAWSEQVKSLLALDDPEAEWEF